jgi:hypothetical protein
MLKAQVMKVEGLRVRAEGWTARHRPNRPHSYFRFPFDFYRARQFQINFFCPCCVVDDLVLHIAFTVSTIQVASGFQVKSPAHFLKAITML